MSLDFPWQMFGQAAEAQTRNRRQAMEDAQGIGQNVSGFADKALAFSRQKALKDIISKMLAGQQGAAQPGAAPQTAGMGGAMTAAPKPSMASDPQLSPILQMLQADPSLIPETLPALAKGMSKSSRSTELTPFQSGSLKLRERQMRDTENYQAARTKLGEIETFLRSKGLKNQAARVRAAIADLDSKHPFMYGLGLMQPPSEAAGLDNEEGGSGSDPLGLNQ